MSVEYWLVGVVVAAAVAYLVRVIWKTWAGKPGGCGSGCGKCAVPTPVTVVNGRRSLPQV